MKFKILFIFSLFLTYKGIIAQSVQDGIRCDWSGPQWVDNDSTFYDLGPDSTLIVGRNKLYLDVQGDVSLIRDFSLDSGVFVQDFDVIDSDTWYAIIESQSLEQMLLKTLDGGTSWQQDTSYYSALSASFNEPPETISKNQLQRFSNSDTLVLFCGYYFTGILYSKDKGISWHSGFKQLNLPAFYQGFIQCEDRYFIWGEQGDPFYAAMFEIAYDSIFSQTYDPPDCANGFPGDPFPGCYYSNSATIADGLNSCDTAYWDFGNMADSLCMNNPVSVKSELERAKLKILPNPAHDYVEISLETNEKIERIVINTVSGAKVLIDDDPSSNNRYDLPEMNSGCYIIQVYTLREKYSKKLVIIK